MFEERVDAAKLRGAPLGWYFPLFFLIQALMPFGAAVGVAGSQGEMWLAAILVPAGALVSGVAIHFMVRGALRGRKRVAHFGEARKGRRAAARVLSMEQIGSAGMVKKNGRRTSYVKLRVQVQASFEDGIPFVLTGEACYTATERGKLQPGRMVWIGVHPSNDGTFMVHPESLVDAPAPPGAPQAPRGPQIHRVGD